MPHRLLGPVLEDVQVWLRLAPDSRRPPRRRPLAGHGLRIAARGLVTTPASKVMHAWRELTRGQVPHELTTVGRFPNLPPIPQIPGEIRGQSFVVVEACQLGDPARADELLAPLRAPGPAGPG